MYLYPPRFINQCLFRRVGCLVFTFLLNTPRLNTRPETVWLDFVHGSGLVPGVVFKIMALSSYDKDYIGGELGYQHTVHLQRLVRSGCRLRRSIRPRIRLRLDPGGGTTVTTVVGWFTSQRTDDLGEGGKTPFGGFAPSGWCFIRQYPVYFE